MLWFLFIIGCMMVVCGIVLIAYGNYVEIKGLMFDSEILGNGLTALGGVMVAIMLFALLVSYISTLC